MVIGPLVGSYQMGGCASPSWNCVLKKKHRGFRMFIHLFCPKGASVNYKLTHICVVQVFSFIQLC